MQVIKNSFIYLTSSVISKSAPFLLLPFLTSYLTKEEFGMLAVFLVLISLFGAFVGMALHTNISKNFFKKTKCEVANITGNVFIILSETTILYFVVTLMIYFVFDEVFSVPTEYILILPLLAFFMMSNQIFLAVLRNQGRSYLFGAFEILNAFISVGVTITLLMYTDMGWLAQVIGLSVASVVLSVIGIIYLSKSGYLDFKFNWGLIKSILQLSIPLVPHVLGGVVIAVSDRLFIERMVGLEAVALYSIGYSFGMVVSLLTDSIIKAWSPWFYKQLVAPSFEDKLKIIKYTYIYLVMIFIGAWLLSVVGELVLPYAVDEGYYGASQYIFWIAMGYAIQGVYKIFFPYLVHISKTKYLAFSTVLAAILNLIFNFIFIEQYGAIGAAYSTILAFSASAILVFWYQKQNYWMPWLLKPEL